MSIYICLEGGQGESLLDIAIYAYVYICININVSIRMYIQTH
jgi:hypothetical protein